MRLISQNNMSEDKEAISRKFQGKNIGNQSYGSYGRGEIESIIEMLVKQSKMVEEKAPPPAPHQPIVTPNFTTIYTEKNQKPGTSLTQWSKASSRLLESLILSFGSFMVFLDLPWAKGESTA